MKSFVFKVVVLAAFCAAPLVLTGCSDNKAEIPSTFVAKPDKPPTAAGGPVGKGKDKAGGEADS
jgi:hypothetical protein